MQSHRLMLIIAVAAGIVATVLAFTYISSATSERQTEPTVSVLFAVSDLPANHVLDPDHDLRVDSIGTVTSPALARAAVKADEKAAVRGQRINAPLPAGSPLLYGHLAVIEDIKIAPGKRAMSIGVSEENMLGGILVPGDHVDIIVTYPVQQQTEGAGAPAMDMTNPQAALNAVFARALARSSNPSQWESKEVLSNVHILAIGDQLQASRQQFMYGLETGLGGRGGAGTVTIEVTPKQALDLIRSTAGGTNSLTLLLRPPVTQGGQAADDEGTLEDEGS